MNLFEKAQKLQADTESKTRKGSTSPLATTIAMPFFKGNMRKGDENVIVKSTRTAYKLNSKGTASLLDKQGKGIPVTSPVQYNTGKKPIAGTFILSYFACLAYDICKDANQPCTTFLVQALIESEGFTLDEYSQGKIQGSARIAKHLKDIAVREKLAISITEKGLIQGLEKYACKVLAAY